MNKQKIRLHSIGLAKTILNYDYEHCAFTNKIREFPALLEGLNYHIIEYSNGESISKADEKVQILTEKELNSIEGKELSGLNRLLSQFDDPSYNVFVEKLKKEIAKRYRVGDIFLHHYSNFYSFLLKDYPKAIHIEAGIGYNNDDFGAHRVFDSSSWMHYHLGKENKLFPGRYTFVGGNSIDLNRWRPNYEEGKHILFVGRVIKDKGLYVIKEIAKKLNEEILIAGLGEPELFQGKNMKFIGLVTGEEKVELFRNAKALLVPSEYVEPFGIVNIEALSVGTPIITSDFGAFPEIVEQGFNGFRCRTLGDFLEAIKNINKLDRKAISEAARKKYSNQELGKRYDEIIRQIYDLYKDGWYTEESHLHIFKELGDK